MLQLQNLLTSVKHYAYYHEEANVSLELV